jgi:branched-chain amino acid transport system permease protein
VGLVNAVAQGLLLGGLYALFAAGLSIMFGVMRIVNLAHGDLGVVASYLALVVVTHTFLPTWPAVLLTIVLFGAIGYVVQRVLIQRSIEAGALETLLVTFGLSVVLQNGLLEIFSADSRTLDAGAIETSSLHLGQLSLSWIGILGLATALVTIVCIQLFLSRTGTGRMMRAASDDPETASMVGANARHIYAVATAIAFGTVAMAGMIFSMRSSFDPSLGALSLIFAFEAVVIGGLGSLWGTLLGGLTLGLTQTVVAHYDPSLSILAGHLVFLAVLAFRPQGLLAARST